MMAFAAHPGSAVGAGTSQVAELLVSADEDRTACVDDEKRVAADGPGIQRSYRPRYHHPS